MDRRRIESPGLVMIAGGVRRHVAEPQGAVEVSVMGMGQSHHRKADGDRGPEAERGSLHAEGNDEGVDAEEQHADTIDRGTTAIRLGPKETSLAHSDDT